MFFVILGTFIVLQLIFTFYSFYSITYKKQYYLCNQRVESSIFSVEAWFM